MTPAATAICNAVFDATGRRLRLVPFTPGRVKTALAESTGFVPDKSETGWLRLATRVFVRRDGRSTAWSPVLVTRRRATVTSDSQIVSETSYNALARVSSPVRPLSSLSSVAAHGKFTYASSRITLRPCRVRPGPGSPTVTTLSD
jgi:hypothetical protein